MHHCVYDLLDIILQGALLSFKVNIKHKDGDENVLLNWGDVTTTSGNAG